MITELNKELDTLHAAWIELDKHQEVVRVVQPVSNNTRVVVKDVVASQSRIGTTDGDKLAESLAKVLQVTEQTDITAAEWLKETNLDPEP